MAITQATTLNAFKKSPVAGEWGIAWNDTGTVTLTPSTGDIAELFIVPAGTVIQFLSIQNADLGTTVPASIGLIPVDGSTASPSALLASYDFGTATVAGSLYDVILASPVIVETDSFLAVTFGTVSGGASGALGIRAAGNVIGVK